MPDDKPGDGFLGWLGRQIGHVKKAIKTDVTRPQASAQAQPQPQVEPQPQPAPPVEERQIVYRDEKAQEVELPHQPGVVLRRTVIDEVVVDPAKAEPPQGTA